MTVTERTSRTGSTGDGENTKDRLDRMGPSDDDNNGVLMKEAGRDRPGNAWSREN